MARASSVPFSGSIRSQLHPAMPAATVAGLLPLRGLVGRLADLLTLHQAQAAAPPACCP